MSGLAVASVVILVVVMMALWWYSNRRVRQPTAMYKTIIEEGTNRVVGAHLLGPDAEEVINLFALTIRHGLTAKTLSHTIYAYPSSASDVASMVEPRGSPRSIYPAPG